MVEFEVPIIGPTKEEFIRTTQNPVWPFITFKIRKSNKPIINTKLDLEVGPVIYESFLKNFGGDEINLYFSPRGTPFNSWNPDMDIAFTVMEELDSMSKVETWIRNARINISDVLSNKKPDIKPRKNDKVITKCEEILKACKLYDAVTKSELPLVVAKDAINKKNRDPDTTIYRLAMAVYHYIFNDIPVVKGWENWESAYLYFSQDSAIQKKYPKIMKCLEQVPEDNVQGTFKAILAFIIGSYLYYRGVKEIVS